MAEEHKNYDDHDADPYDMASIPYDADPPVESNVEADKISSEEPPPLTQGSPASGDSDIEQAPPPSPFSQAGAVPPVVPQLPGKKRGLHLSLRNAIFLVLILLVV